MKFLCFSIFLNLYLTTAIATNAIHILPRTELRPELDSLARARRFERSSVLMLHRRGQCYGKACPDSAMQESSGRLLEGQQHGSTTAQGVFSTARDKGKGKGKISTEQGQSEPARWQRTANMGSSSRQQTTVRRPATRGKYDTLEVHSKAQENTPIESNSGQAQCDDSKAKTGHKGRRFRNRLATNSKETLSACFGPPVY